MEADKSPPESLVDEVVKTELASSPSKGRFEDARSEQTAGRKRRDKPFYLKRYRAGWLLLVLFIIMIVGAFLLYPRRSAAYRPGPLHLSISTAGRVETINVTIQSPPVTINSQLIVSLVIDTPVKATTPMTTFLEISGLPNDATPQNCHPISEHCYRGYVAASTTLHTVAQSNGERQWLGSFDIQFAGPALAWTTNGLQAEAQLPEISIGPPLEITSKGQRLVPSNPTVTIDYYIPDPASYDWAGGPAPIAMPGGSCNSCVIAGPLPAYVEWVDELSEAYSPA